VNRLDDLPPDLHAVLSLVLSRGKGYAEVAVIVGVEERAVHDRAHAALVMLAPREARELSAAQRERVGEYVLGQDEDTAAGETRAYLESSAPARAWAQALVAELAPLASGPLPEIPAGDAAAVASPAAAAPAAPRSTQPEEPSATPPAAELPASPAAEHEAQGATGTAPTSRVGGMVVLGVVAAAVIAAVVLIVGVGGGGSSHTGSSTNANSASAASSAATTSSTPATTSTAATGTSTSKTAAGEPHIDATLPLTSPNPADKALGIVEVVSRGSQQAFIVVAEHLPPTTGFQYAAWLYNSPSDAVLLGSGPKVGSNGILKAAGGLPANAASFRKIILTEERGTKQPTQPGPIALSGPFKLS
jgi:hypothetical protein